MVNNYILIASEIYTEEYGDLSGYDVTEYRIDDRLWPLYKFTRNKNLIKANDNLLIYIAGKKQYGKSFVASAKVSAIEDYDKKKHYKEYEPIYINPVKMICMKEVKWFDKPIEISNLLSKLTIIPNNRKKWGCIMHGGCRRLNDVDYDTILNSAS